MSLVRRLKSFPLRPTIPSHSLFPKLTPVLLQFVHLILILASIRATDLRSLEMIAAHHGHRQPQANNCRPTVTDTPSATIASDRCRPRLKLHRCLSRLFYYCRESTLKGRHHERIMLVRLLSASIILIAASGQRFWASLVSVPDFSRQHYDETAMKQ